MSLTASPKDPQALRHGTEATIAPEDDALHQGLGPRQLQMIAIGGAIGTGLFLGAGGRLASAGPGLALDYLVCGFIAYLILRAIGELVVHRPSSGSFVSYAREFYGERAAYISGWMYWINWATTSIVDSTAIALYVKWFGQYFHWLDAVPQGLIALVLIIGAMNFASQATGFKEVPTSEVVAIINGTDKLNKVELIDGEQTIRVTKDDGKTKIINNALGIMGASTHPELSFTSTAIAGSWDEGKVEGTLTVNGRSEVQQFDVAREADGRYRLTGTISQSRYGIKPYSAMMGALRLGEGPEHHAVRGHVVPHRVREQGRVLEGDGGEGAQRGEVHVADVDVVDRDRAGPAEVPGASSSSTPLQAGGRWEPSL